MPKAPANTDRKSNGTFAKGNKLGGGKAGSRHKVTKAVEALLEGEAGRDAGCLEGGLCLFDAVRPV